MRIRSIKPQFFHDSKILDVPPLARLLFIGLWCAADREGRLEYQPRELRLDILPEETPKTVVGLFSALESAGLIVCYEVENRKYLHIPNFLKHQTPYHKEQPSTCPEPVRVMTLTSSGHDRSVICHLSTVLGAVLPSTEIAVVPAERLTARPINGHSVKPSPLAKNGEREQLRSDFDTLYSYYPRHVGREAAFKSFVRLDPDRDTLHAMVADFKRRVDNGEWIPDTENMRYIPHLSTYLNQRRWADE